VDIFVAQNGLGNAVGSMAEDDEEWDKYFLDHIQEPDYSS
jgi:hypothetical protein